MTSAPFTVAAAQFSCSPSKEENIHRACRAIARAAKQGADLVVLPELHTSRYFCQSSDPQAFAQAEPIPGPLTRVFAEAARQARCLVIASLFEQDRSGIYYNTAVVFERDGEIAGVYRKTHIPDDPGYREKFYFAPGNGEFLPIPTSIGKLGVLICWDQWFPEAARLMALAGADLLFYPSAIGWDKQDPADEQQRQLDAWITVQRGHAVANALPLVAVNRHGFEPAPPDADVRGIRFWGHSFISGPQGEILRQADAENDALLLATIFPDKTEQLRRVWTFFRDRRTDAYTGLLQRQRQADSSGGVIPSSLVQPSSNLKKTPS